MFRATLVMVLTFLAAPVSATDFAKQAVPEKWYARVTPEEGEKLDFPKYYNALDKARSLMFHGRYRAALMALAKTTGTDRGTVALIRAACLHATGEHERALAELSDPAISAAPKSQVLRATILADIGKTDDAIKLLTAHLHENPNSVAGHFYLGQVNEQTGNLDQARSAYHWFIDDQKFLDKWLGNVSGEFDDAEQVTLIGRAIDRWATLTGAYQGNTQLHNVILNIFVRAYDQIDREYWPAHVAAAEYFQTHDNAPEAGKEFKAALGANPNDLRALRGIAQIGLDKFNFDGVDEAVKDIRSEDEHSPVADLLAARNLLRQRRPNEARKPVERVLKQQPRNLEALGLLAATHALELEDQKTAAVLKQVDSLDPDNATAYNEVAEQLGARRQYPRSAAMYKIAIERAPWWTDPRNGLGLLYTQSGDEDLARATLEAARLLDPFNLETTNYLRLLDDLAKFATSETEHFVVYYDAKADPLIPEYFGKYLESIYKDVTSEYKTEPKVKTYIEVFPTHDAFSVRTTGSPWIGTVGASTGRVIALCSPRNGAGTMGTFNWAQVLRHEFTHTVTLAATDNRIAHWMTEGLAVVEERSPLRWEWVPMLYDAVKKKKLFTIADLTWGFVRPKKPSDRQLAYAESHWICQYINEKYGHDAILKMLAEFKAGRSEPDTFKKVLGVEVAIFEQEFYKWTEKQVESWGYDEQTTKKVDKLKEEGKSLIDSKQYADALKVWEQIGKLRPMDQEPHMRLAVLYLKANEPEKALKHFEALHAVELNDNRYAKRIARLYRDENRLEPAIKYAVQSVYIDPYDADAHELLAELYAKANDDSAVTHERRVIAILSSRKAP